MLLNKQQNTESLDNRSNLEKYNGRTFKFNNIVNDSNNLRATTFAQKLEDGGDILNEGSPEFKRKKEEYIKSLDNFIKNNPKIKGLNTKDFRDFFIQLVYKESSYDKNTNNGSHRGYYQMEYPSNLPADIQHKKAYYHLANLFNESITDHDIKKARKMGFSDDALLAKYWNQQNYVTNYLHNGIDHADEIGTLVSKYGNDIDTDLDILPYALKAFTDDYYIMKPGDTSADAIKRARNSDMKYNNRDSVVLSFNKDRRLTHGRNKNVKFDFNNLWPGDTIYLTNYRNKNK